MNNDGLEFAKYPAPAGVVFRAGPLVGGAICPRCPVFIATTSRVMRLPYPEEPDTLDGWRDRRTGKAYRSDGHNISMKPRWWIHARCAEPGEIKEKAPGL